MLIFQLDPEITERCTYHYMNIFVQINHSAVLRKPKSNLLCSISGATKYNEERERKKT